MRPLVSIVTTFLNAEAFLAEAIDSVEAQTMADWELLLIDDGSRDGGTAIAQQAAMRLPEKIRYFTHPGHANLGMYESRGLGLREARGAYVTSLDADDLFMSDNLAEGIALFEKYPEIDAAFSATLFWQWDSRFAYREDTLQSFGALADRVVPPPDLLLAMLEDESQHPANCGSLIRRQTLLDVGGYEVAFKGMYEDSVLLSKVLLRSPCYVSSKCLSAYRAHSQSQCHKAADEGTYAAEGPSETRRIYLEWALDYADAHGQPGVVEAIRRELSTQKLPRRSLAKRAIGRILRAVKPLLQRDVPPEGDDAVLHSLTRIAAFYDQTGRVDAASTVAQRIESIQGQRQR